MPKCDRPTGPEEMQPLPYKKVSNIAARVDSRAAAGFGCAGLAALAVAAGAQAQQTGRLLTEARFSADQAAAGRTAYGAECASCHGGGLDDGQFAPPLKGAAFVAKWGGQGPAALLDYIQSKMPPAGPGSLGAATYGAINAYILQANGAAAGQAGAAVASAAAAPAPPAAQQPPADAISDLGAPGRDATYREAMAKRTAKLEAMSPVTDAMLRSPPPGDWLMWRRTFDSSGHSPLNQIAKRNVGQLRAVWSLTIPTSQNEISPVVHDGVMFLESATTVQAIDAVTGDPLWQYVRKAPDNLTSGRTTRVKGFALYEDKLIVPTPDGHVVALEAKSGKVLWDHEVVTDYQAGLTGEARGATLQLDGGPIVVNGKVILGVSLGISVAKGGCFIVALDSGTGNEVWRFMTVDQRPPGQDSWNGAPVQERFGGGVWTAGSYDPELNLVYFGAGNTYSAGTLLLPKPQKGASNDALYTDATLALNPDTGKLVWHYQHMNRDVWDMDWVFEQTLATVPVNGKPRRLVVTGGKIAMFDAVDAATGEYVFTKDIGLQNLVTAVDPKTGKKTTNPALEPESGKAKFLCPYSTGFRNWPATSFNPRTKILYVPLMETCGDYTYTARPPEEVATGGLDMRFVRRPVPNHDGNAGRIEAINLETKQVVWSMRQRSPLSSSMLSTDGGLVFNASLDRRFSAYDETTGKVLWQTRLQAPASSSPISYSVNGKQYVAVVTGSGNAVDTTARILAPEINSPPGGGAVVVFALP